MSDFTFEINDNILRNEDILEYFENDYPYDEISEEKRDELYDVLDEMIKDAIVNGYIDRGLVYAMQELDWFYVDSKQVMTKNITYYDLEKSCLTAQYFYNINNKFYSLQIEEGVGWTRIEKQPHEVRAKQVISTIYEEMEEQDVVDDKNNFSHRRKFKVGDKVKILVPAQGIKDDYTGCIGQVIKVGKGCNDYFVCPLGGDIYNTWWYDKYELEAIENDN